MTRAIPLSLLTACLVAAAGVAQAQAWTAAGSSDVPVRAGEASTLTHGVPNAATTNSPWPDGTPVIVGQPVPATVTVVPHAYVVPAPVVHERVDAYRRGKASVSTDVPGRAGEASTMTHGVPNMATSNGPAQPATVHVITAMPLHQHAVVNPPVYYHPYR